MEKGADLMYEGWVKALLPEITPTAQFTAQRIPPEKWNLLCSFLRWSCISEGVESIVHLFYHPEKKEWEVAVFPQKAQAWTVKAQLDATPYIKAGYLLAGTIHHHNNGAAGQSGVDRTDEEKSSGLHMTLGSLKSENMSVHIRLVLGGIEYQAQPLAAYIDHPAPLSPTETEAEVPEEWKKRLTKETWASTTNAHYKGGYVYSEGGQGWEYKQVGRSSRSYEVMDEADFQALSIDSLSRRLKGGPVEVENASGSMKLKVSPTLARILCDENGFFRTAEKNTPTPYRGKMKGKDGDIVILLTPAQAENLRSRGCDVTPIPREEARELKRGMREMTVTLHGGGKATAFCH